MLRRLRNRERGFTLIELLIVVAIIGIIAALLIPNFLDALQKAKQKRTVADERNVGTAMMSWLTDQVGAAAAGASSTPWDSSGYTDKTFTEVASVLVPQYIQQVPEKDGWGNGFSYFLNTTSFAANIMAVVSFGRDGLADNGTSYTAGSFFPTDYDQDIVWADGFFVRWPQGNN